MPTLMQLSTNFVLVKMLFNLWIDRQIDALQVKLKVQLFVDKASGCSDEGFYSWDARHFTFRTTWDDLCSSSCCVPHYSQTGVSIPVNPYIHFLVSLHFMALKEFVPAPQTHVLLCQNVGATPEGKVSSSFYFLLGFFS